MKFTVRFQDMLGDVDATFESLEDYLKFRGDLMAAREARAKEAAAAKQEEERRQAEQEAMHRVELKSMACDLVKKAMDYGVGPLSLFMLIKEVMLAAVVVEKPNDDEDEGEGGGEDAETPSDGE